MNRKAFGTSFLYLVDFNIEFVGHFKPLAFRPYKNLGEDKNIVWLDSLETNTIIETFSYRLKKAKNIL